MRAVFLTLLLLTGCSSPTPGFIIAPQVFLPQSNQLQQSRFGQLRACTGHISLS